jgi:transglutaminase-like putative cysteine protease
MPHAGAAELSKAVLARFRTQHYRYTLEPPLLGRDAVDEFLFGSKAGFCEHYAGAYVVLMRAMGVAARVVTGYQGGELNPVDGYYTVRQSDAHAWAEIWTSAAGWQRVDPTAAVAPERIERNRRARCRARRLRGCAAAGAAKRSRFVAGATQIPLCGVE